ncbi:AAA family ATPase [Flavobacterium sp. ZB4R12]|uniref:AAA family ATPase n=1 Tax=Flavobacterium sp. ZB4R12 TaxID=3398732 RepID=UPI003AACDD6B
MKINRITINNFKVFKKRNINFDSSDLLVFDGPNGFGKTTIYDAIELLLTGNIRRYNALDKLIVDGRESYEEHPFYNEGATGDISICIEFSKGSNTYYLERFAKRDELTNSIDFSKYHLYQKENFESLEKNLILNEEEFLSEILGANYKENFQFLNYIEQEDSLYLLKNQDKNRKLHISHLFNVSEFENKIEKIKKIKQKIDGLCNSEVKLVLDNLKKEIKDIQDLLAKEFIETEYFRLFPEKNFIWDEPNYDFKTYNQKSLLQEEGILIRLNHFVNNKPLFSDFIHNETIDTLIRNEELIKDFCRYFSFIDKKEELLQSKTNYNKKLNYSERLSEFSIDDLKDEFFEYDFEDMTFLDSDLIDEFNDYLDELKKQVDELDKLDSIYSRINESREKLKENIEKLKEEDEELTSGSCFLCGHKWNDIEDLLGNIALQSDNLEKITGEKNKLFNDNLEAFKEEIIGQIIESINLDLSENKVDTEFINKLVTFEDIRFNSTTKNFDKIKFNYNPYLNELLSIDSEIDFEKLVSDLKLDKKEVATEHIEVYFKEYFNDFFDNKFENINLLDVDNIKKKTDYLKYQYSLLQNEFLITKKEDLELKEEKFNNATNLSKQLKSLKDIYESSLKKYQKKVIKDIEIIFHIYSGRIMQDFQGGLGLFIYSDKNGIRFQTNPTKTFDAVFSMSSGQLSALIISFTLALHKKYSQNKIILIDDPVQTMDELNVVGFIELLRNEFNQNQIIISTHEDMMSAFMRYKFKNYNLSQKRVNLKSLN